MLNESLAVELNDVEGLQHVILLYDLLCLHGEIKVALVRECFRIGRVLRFI